MLQFMLSVDDDRLTPLREQATSAVVTGMCKCGCATIDLVVDRNRSRPAALDSPVVSTSSKFITGDPPGELFDLLVFLDEGWLSLLEIAWYDEPPKEFPAPAAFHPPRIWTVPAG